MSNPKWKEVSNYAKIKEELMHIYDASNDNKSRIHEINIQN